MSSLSKFQETLKRNGIARSNRFKVRLTLPNAMAVGYNVDEIALFCEESTIPGRGYSTVPRGAGVNGLQEFVPYDKLYDDINMTFRCSEDMIERVFFEDWFETISGTNNRFAYLDDYATNIEVVQLNSQDQEIMSFTLEEAYPTVVAEINLSQAPNEYNRFQVTFKYKKYRIS